MVPKTQQFSFKINDTTQILDVPIITLFNHNNLNLSEVKVSLNIKNFISNNKLLNIEVGSNQNNNESNTNEGTIEIIFKKILPMKALHVSNKKLLNNFNFYK